MASIEPIDDKILIPCRKVKYSPFVDIEDCKKCEYHIKVELVSEADPDKHRPALWDILCTVPVRIRAAQMVSLKEE